MGMRVDFYFGMNRRINNFFFFPHFFSFSFFCLYG